MAHAYQPPTAISRLCRVCGLSEEDGDHVPAVQEATARLRPTLAMRAMMRPTQQPEPIILHPREYTGPSGFLDFNLHMHLHRQRTFSFYTFGPGTRTAAILDHIRDELKEIEYAPTDLSEWIDVVILALDGAWRAGHTPSEIIEALIAKQAKNESRTWPDWRTTDPNQAIQHLPTDHPSDCHCETCNAHGGKS